MKKKKGASKGQIILHIFFILLCLCYVYPILLLISVSFEGTEHLKFNLIPIEFSLKAYTQIFANPKKIIDGYAVTIFYSTVATIASLFVMAMFAYALSKRDFKYRGILTFLLFFTTLFSGGLVPSYIINSKYLHLNNTVWIYVLPVLLSAWNTIVLRTFIQGLPEGLDEAAKLDGASEFRICFQIMLPLTKPALASVGFLTFVSLWNDWQVSSIYIRDPELYSLQYMLKIILDSTEALQEMVNSGSVYLTDAEDQLKNLESLRFSMAVVAAGPMMFIFPFFQKYFAEGLTLGSVKG